MQLVCRKIDMLSMAGWGRRRSALWMCKKCGSTPDRRGMDWRLSPKPGWRANRASGRGFLCMYWPGPELRRYCGRGEGGEDTKSVNLCKLM